MTAAPVDDEQQNAPAEDFTAQVYGSAPIAAPVLPQRVKKTNFAPWHHPVKQIVRDYQWGDQAKRLVKDHRAADARGVIRYFTLPGADLLDVRSLSKALEDFGSKIEYFGFNIGYKSTDNEEDIDLEKAGYFSSESALRQAGRTTDSAVVLPDRLEDIAEPTSQAANRLRQQAVFDIINLDACDHLGYKPKGRAHSLFDALEALLAHQLKAEKPWLLFITTRARADQLGEAGMKLQSAITENLKQHPEEFGAALAATICGSKLTIGTDLAKTWSSSGEMFLRLFVTSIGKHILQFYHGQPNFLNDVELVSAFCYRVHDSDPDMLSIGFRISPNGIKVHPATAGSVAIGKAVELKSAVSLAEKAAKIWEIDGETGIGDDAVRYDAVSGTIDLLDATDYDIGAWENWLQNHNIRPMTV